MSINTPDELIVTVISVPSSVVTSCPLDSIPDITLSATTWCFKIFVNCGISFNNAVTVPAGSKLNAPSVGANNVKGPAPDKTPSNAHASIAVLSVV